MSPPSIWTILGIPPSHDHRDIRRAYVKKLKVTNPEDDPEGFKMLRAAYEYALYEATQHSVAHDVPEDSASEPSDTDAPEVPGQIPSETSAPDKTVPPIVDEVSRIFFETVERLEWQLHPDSNARDEDRKATLEAILSSPMLDSIDARERTEFWLAKLASHTLPRSDVLISRLIDYFDWDSQLLNRPQAYTIRVIRQREIDLRFLRDLRQAGDGSTEALRLLSQPARPHTIWQRLWQKAKQSDIAGLLHQVNNDHPTLIEDLDSESVRVWTERVQTRDMFDRTRGWLLMFIPMGIVAMLFTWLNWGPHPALIAILAAIPVAAFGCALGYEHIYIRLRFTWENSKHLQQNRWLAFGWGPALLVVLCLAALRPSLGLTILITLLSVGVAFWAAVTGHPDTNPGALPWQVRLMGAEFILVAWWLCGVWDIPAAAAWQMTPAVVAATLVSGFGQLPLFHQWLRVPPWAQRTVLCGLIIGMICALEPLMRSDMPPYWKAPAFASTAVMVLLNRVPTLAIDHWTFRVRNVIIGLVLLATLTQDESMSMSFAGATLLLWGALNAALALFNTWRKPTTG